MPDLDANSKIDICILFDITASPWGGGNQFLRSIASELSRLGHSVTNRPTSNTQVVLLNAFLYAQGRHFRPGQIAQLRQTGTMTRLGRVIPPVLQMLRPRKGPILVHRVDGVPGVVRGTWSRSDRVQTSVNRLADHTIFQSEYCKTSFEEHSATPPTSWRVIQNAVDPQVFYPAPDGAWSGGVLRLAAVSWSDNPRKGFAAMAEASRLPGVEVTFVGRWCADVHPANVKMAGVLESAKIADVLRSSHAMLHPAWNEPCSNAIIEAMACGLPVIYRDSGGNRELAGKYGVPMTEDGDLPAALDDLRRQYRSLRKKVLQNRASFLINRAANEYLAMIRYAIDTRRGNKAPSP